VLKSKDRWAVLIVAALLVGPILTFTFAGPTDGTKTGDKLTHVDKSGDEELAYLLVKLEKRTRQVIAGHYGRQQPEGAEATATYKGYLIKNLILPAAVADPIFSEVVPEATGGRAWVKMVVPEPRNPNNQGDATALAMLAALRNGGDAVWRTNEGAHYYAEPIVAKAGCLPCHGAPAGEPDVHGEVIGAVVARVAPED